MAVNVVNPDYLKELAKYQKDAAADALNASTAVANVPGKCGETHGLISAGSNGPMDPLQVARYDAATQIKDVSLWLAAKLEGGGQLWAAVDQELAQNFDRQTQNG
jgi:hypothetical protein